MPACPFMPHRSEPVTLLTLIRNCGYRGGSEYELQEALAAAFRNAECEFVREMPLGSPKDRVDFWFHGFAIECKVDGGAAAITRQLDRYAKHPVVEALILVTTKMRHAAHVPEELQGKPVHVVVLTQLP